MMTRNIECRRIMRQGACNQVGLWPQPCRFGSAQAGSSAVKELRVDGGASVNDLLMQFQADLLGIPVVRPVITETTALGAAYLAGLSTGIFRSTDEIGGLWQAERRFEPSVAPSHAAELMARWEHAVRQTVLAPER